MIQIAAAMHSPRSPRGVLWWNESDEMLVTTMQELARESDD